MTKTALTKYDKATLDTANIRNDTFVERLFLTWVYKVVAKGRKGTIVQVTSAQVASRAFLSIL